MNGSLGIRLAPLLALALAAAACGGGVEETRFVNFDAESSGGALARGWSGFEKTAETDTFAWAQARSAKVRILARAGGDRLVRFRAWPFRWEGAPPQKVTVSVNDVRLGTVTLHDGPRVYALVSPGPAWSSGDNTLTFEFAYAEAPRDRIPGAGDTRTLAAAFDWLEILPAGAAVPGRP